MVVNIDVRLLCQKLKAKKPPYKCPVENCNKVYKSYCGIRSHLYNHHSDFGQEHLPSASEGRSINGRWHHRKIGRPSRLQNIFPSPVKEPLTAEDSKHILEFNMNGKCLKISQYDSLEITDKVLLHGATDRKAMENEKKALAVKMPVANFRILEKYVRPVHQPAVLPTTYFKYVEKTAEELNEEMEYDMDEEDYAWLDFYNKRRKEKNCSEVPSGIFELVMDRFEKEAFFLSQSPGKKDRLLSSSVDEDAVCAICLDGECQNSNAILFCDMCNLAVHQECYGVPYIPEGQWLCRRCLQSPSRAVSCCFCPNKEGAFKQTSDNRWAHVVCALWIPEVCFANTVFLEPIDGIENVPISRWRLKCYVCNKQNVGACIQCHRTSCRTAFHVTCAQQIGLYMKITPVSESGIDGVSVTNVRKTAFCDIHAPPDSSPYQPMIVHSFDSNDEDDEDSHSATKPAKAKAISRKKMRQARKILAEKRRAPPSISIPVLSNDTLIKIAGRVHLENKEDFLSHMKAYWTLKRQSRNGVPLLRRLQTNHQTKNKDQVKLLNKENESSRTNPAQEKDFLASTEDLVMKIKQSSDSKSLCDMDLNDVNTQDSVGSALESINWELSGSNLAEVNDLKVEVKPKISFLPKLDSTHTATVSESENTAYLRRPAQLSSGSKCHFQLAKDNPIFDGKVKVEETTLKEVNLGNLDPTEDRELTKQKDISLMKIKLHTVKGRKRRRHINNDVVDKVGPAEDDGENIKVVLKKEERKLRKKRKFDEDFKYADVEQQEINNLAAETESEKEKMTDVGGDKIACFEKRLFRTKKKKVPTATLR